MISDIFIKRPRFAIVISLVITIAGALAFLALPTEQFPNITPPQVSVEATYPGANAEAVESSVAQQIESVVNGVEDMLYMSSISSDDGRYSLTVTFRVGTNPSIAAVNVQNRVKQVESTLPEDVTRLGVNVRQRQSSMLQIYGLTSVDGRYDIKYLTNYLLLNIKDEIGRVKGVGDVQVFSSSQYSMRIWVDSDRLKSLKLSVSDIIGAVQSQNIQASVGRIGSMPTRKDQLFQITLTAQGRLSEVSDFENIVIRANGDGSYLLLKDVARVELGANGEEIVSYISGKPAANFAIYQSPGSNAIEVADGITKILDGLKGKMPEGMEVINLFDNAGFVKNSMSEIGHTLVEAFVLIILIIYLFLGSAKTTLIPLVAIPVSLIGTFAVMSVFGITLNTVSLLAIVVVIGVVVDDAIVVVEAVEVHLEKGRQPREAALLAMKDVGFTIVGITFALVSVFLPMTMLGGLTGRLYEQFALTLALSVAISAFNSLTLSPALCALILKPKDHQARPFILVRVFNRFYGAVFKGYSAGVGVVTRRAVITVVIFAAVYLGLAGAMKVIPTSLVPGEDQRVFFVAMQMPNGTAQHRTIEVSNAMALALKKQIPEIESVATLGGNQLATGAQSSSVASFIILLKPWEERQGPGQDALTLIGRAQRLVTDQFQEPLSMAFNVPTINGLGLGLGLTLEVENQGDDQEPSALGEPVLKLQKAFLELPELAAPFSAFSLQGKMTRLTVDREKAKTQGVALSDVFDTVGTFLGGSYINDFQEFGRTYKVMMQAQDGYRATPDSLRMFYMRTNFGDLVPVSTFITARDTTGPEFLTRYNLYPNLEFMASPAPGYSSGEAMAAMMAKAREILPTGFGFEWTGQSYQEQLAAGQTAVVLALAFICCFLVLAGLYESFTSPLVVMLSVAIAVLGAVVGQMARGLTMDVFMQVGLVMLIGLAAKNAILIVQFAQERQKEGHPPAEAAQLAGQERLRPILMTSFAFILGVLPLVVASGAGANSRHSLGTPVFFGMIVATGLGVFAIPGLYVLVQRLKGKWKKEAVVNGD